MRSPGWRSLVVAVVMAVPLGCTSGAITMNSRRSQVGAAPIERLLVLANCSSTQVEVPAVLAADKREIEAHIVELDKQIIAGRDDPAQRERRRDALWALDDVKAAIAYHNPLVTRMRVPQPATLARARELLDDRTMLLAYLMTSDEAVAIAVTRSDARLFVIEGGFVHLRIPGVDNVQVVSAPAVRLIGYPTPQSGAA